ncbi:MAG: hypothetical protein K8W52_36255 [Deltaproteobacteria bacterium]|nr:hypothetical protein [Deltaproteobacteria bacterium]
MSFDDDDEAALGALDALVPEAGARYVLERVADRGDHAQYKAAIVSADARWDYDAILRDDGRVELTAITAAPEAQAAMLAMIAKLVARATPNRKADGLAAWPPRIQRWRGPGRGA